MSRLPADQPLLSGKQRRILLPNGLARQAIVLIVIEISGALHYHAALCTKPLPLPLLLTL
jgi:hypothetical protein